MLTTGPETRLTLGAGDDIKVKVTHREKEMELTKEQLMLGEKVQKFVAQGEPGFFVVPGYAGVGKTTTIFHFLGKSVKCLVAPTHEALQTLVNSYRLAHPEECTPAHGSLAAFLGKAPVDPLPPTPHDLEVFDRLSSQEKLTPEESELLKRLRSMVTPSDRVFTGVGKSFADNLPPRSLVVLDEAGMLSKGSIEEIVSTYKHKFLFIMLGDPAQCPPIDSDRADGEPSEIFEYSCVNPLIQVMRTNCEYISEQTRKWREVAICKDPQQVLNFLNGDFKRTSTFRVRAKLLEKQTVVVSCNHDKVFQFHELLYEARQEQLSKEEGYSGYEVGDTLISYGNFRSDNVLILHNSARLTVVDPDEARGRGAYVWEGALGMFCKRTFEGEKTNTLLYGEHPFFTVAAEDVHGKLFCFPLPRLGLNHHRHKENYLALYRALIKGHTKRQGLSEYLEQITGLFCSPKNDMKQLTQSEFRTARQVLVSSFLEPYDCKKVSGQRSARQDLFPDIRHSSAMTIHKSQGASIPSVTVDLGSIKNWATGWNARPLDAAMMGYTAVSRAKSELMYV